MSSTATKKNSISSVQNASMRSLSHLELMPTELIQEVLWSSLNLNLTTVSPMLARKLNNNALRRDFIFLAFFRYRLDISKPQQNETSAKPNEWMSYYHSRRGTNFDTQSKYILINSIVDQAWYSAELVFSCQQLYLSKILPSALSNLLEPDLKVSTKSWTIIQQNQPEQFPQWFKDLLSLQHADGDVPPSTMQHLGAERPEEGLKRRTSTEVCSYGANRFQVSLRNSCVAGSYEPSQLEWNINDNTTQHTYTFRVAMIEWSRGPTQPNPILFNPTTWTMNNLALLLMLIDKYPVSRQDSALCAAISSGLASAISQKFVPAVFTRYSVWVDISRTRMKPETLGRLLAPMREHVHQQAIRGDESASTKWMQEWYTYAQNSLLGCFRSHNINKTLLTSEHLIKAMKTVCESNFDIASYYIFCWLSVSLIIKLDYGVWHDSEHTLDQVCDLAVASDTEYAFKSYEYLSNALDIYWSRCRHRKRPVEKCGAGS